MEQYFEKEKTHAAEIGVLAVGLAKKTEPCGCIDYAPG